MTGVVLLSCFLGIALVGGGVLLFRLYRLQAKVKLQSQGLEIERQSIAALIEMASREMRQARSVEPFLGGFAEFIRRTGGVSGTAIFTRREDGYQGVTVAGMFPPLRPVDAATFHRLLGDDHAHAEQIRGVSFDPGFEPFAAVCMRQAPVVYTSGRPQWMPTESWSDFRGIALLPIRFSGETVGILLAAVRAGDEPLSDDSADRLLPLCEIVGICMNAITATLDRIHAQRRYQSAREEGMLQVTTGIVHNIGNAAAVIELRLEELRREAVDEDANLVELLDAELLPIIREAAEAEAFRGSAAGAGFLEAMEMLVAQFQRNLDRTGSALDAVAKRLSGMQRILALQQRFAGELGTEEPVQIHQPLQDALVIVQPALEESDVMVVQEFDKTTPDVLVDRSMLMQVYVNLLQNAVDVLSKQEQPREILVRTGVKVIHAEPWIYADIGDSGPGMPTGVFHALKNMKVSTMTVTGIPVVSEQQESEMFGRGLDYLRRVLRKYDGRLEVRRPADGGTRIRIMLRPALT